eukprot:1210720-Rhodomonas_salina.1
MPHPHLTPYTLHPKSPALHPTLSARNPTPYTLTLRLSPPKPHTLIPTTHTMLTKNIQTLADQSYSRGAAQRGA